MWNEIKKINEFELDECIIEELWKLEKLTEIPYEELEERFYVLNCYENTPAHRQHQRMALYFIRYEINRITGNVKKRRS